MPTYYYAVSLSGYETYSPSIIAVEQEIPDFEKQVEELFTEILLTVPDLFSLDYSMHEAISRKLAEKYHGHIVDFVEEYSLDEFTIHNIAFPASEIAHHEILDRKYYSGDSQPPEPLFPDFVPDEKRDEIFQRFVDRYRELVIEWSKEKQEQGDI